MRCFFDDIACWGWASAPARRLLFASDLPRLPEPMPRALPPDVDRALMAAVADLDDLFTRTGLRLLRATGLRVGELLDLELDCLVDFAGHGTWLRVPEGKLGTERMVPWNQTSWPSWTPGPHSGIRSGPFRIPATADLPSSCSASAGSGPPPGGCARGYWLRSLPPTCAMPAAACCTSPHTGSGIPMARA